MKVLFFDYELPAERIAQSPAERGSSRLLVLDRRTGRSPIGDSPIFPRFSRPGMSSYPTTSGCGMRGCGRATPRTG